MKLKFHILFLILFLSSCSYFKSNIELSDYITINSTPPSAEVYSESGELLGVTPFKLTKEQLTSVQKNSVASLVFKKINHMDRQLIFTNLGVSEINVNLSKLNEKLIKDLISGPLSKDVNEILKKMIHVQEGIITKKLLSSEEILAQLSKDYPNIASFYVLEAAIDIQNKKFEHAKIILEKSLMIDTTNELAKSYLNFINQRLNP
ncbi:MAG: hypothetical protein Q7U04_16420 [Bacteriovorax sp.]|nr:hypothetical protein [Bacteriovorax sp.]